MASPGGADEAANGAPPSALAGLAAMKPMMPTMSKLPLGQMLVANAANAGDAGAPPDRTGTTPRGSQSARSVTFNVEDDGGEEKGKLTARDDEETHLDTGRISQLSKDVLKRTQPLKLKKGTLLGSFPFYKEFHIDFTVTLRKKVPKSKNERNLLHCSVNSSAKSSMPIINVVPGASCLVLRMHEDNYVVDLHNPKELELGVPTKVSFTLSAAQPPGKIIFTVGDQEVRHAAGQLRVPDFMPVSVYMSSAWMVAADAIVQDFVIQQRVKATNEGDFVADEKANLQMPKAEKVMIETTQRELEENRKWRKFDTIFGVLLVINSLLIGITTEMWDQEDLIKKGGLFWMLENFFLVVFSLEVFLRAVITGRSWYKVMPKDGWVIFDCCVLTFGVFDLHVFDEMPGFLKCLRLLRLIKLAKMVRLVRVFKELGLLLAGVLNSYMTLIYTFFLVALMEYVAAIIMVRLAGMAGCKGKDQEGAPAYLAEACDDDWTSVAGAMWRLTLMITFDGWVDYVRRPLFTLGFPWGFLMSVVLLVTIVFAGLGLLNMVIGVLCSIAFDLDKKEKRRTGVELLLRQDKALGQFRLLLQNSGQRPLFKSDKFVTSEELFTEILDEPVVQEQTDILALQRSDFVQLCDAFEEGGEIEVSGFIEAIGIRELQQYFDKLTMDLFPGRIMSSLRPADALFTSLTIKEVESKLYNMEDHANGACSLMYDALQCLMERAQIAHTWARLDKPIWRPPPRQDCRNLPILSVHTLKKIADQHRITKEESDLSIRIDMLFGSFIIINGGFVGLQVVNENPALKPLLYWGDNIFTLIFCVEFVLRGILQANIDDINRSMIGAEGSIYQIAQQTSGKLAKLQKRIRFFGLLPPLPDGGCLDVFKCICRMLKDLSTLFDFVIIFMSLLDSVVIVQLRNSGVLKLDTSMLSVLRIFRLFRLAKLLRIFKLLPQLQLLVFALANVWKTIGWAMLLILVVLYMFSIYCIVLIARSEDGLQDNEIQYWFGDIPSAMLTGWQLVVLDELDVITNKIKDSNAFIMHMPLFFAIIIVLGIGMMKIAVGVLCESAISLLMARDAEKIREEFLCFVRGLCELEELFTTELGTHLLSQEILEHCLDISIRPKNQVLEIHEAHTTLVDDPELHAIEWRTGMSDDFKQKLNQAVQNARLSPELVKRVFEMVDYDRTGKISVDALARGALTCKENLSRIEMYAMITGIRDLRALSATMSERLKVFQELLNGVLMDVQALIQRHGGSHRQDGGQHTSRATKEAKVGELSPEGELALQDLATFNGEDMLPDIMGLGRLKVVSGSGKVQLYGDTVSGDMTNFRGEVRMGDIIVFDYEISLPAGKATKTFGLAVLTVLNPHSLKVGKHPTLDSTNTFVEFMIARRVPFTKFRHAVPDEVVTVQKDEKDDCGFTVPDLGAPYIKSLQEDRRSDLPHLENMRVGDSIVSVDGKAVITGEEFNRLTINSRKFHMALVHEDETNLFKVTLPAPPSSDLSPRSAQNFFSWGLRTKHRDTAHIKRHEEKRADLLTQVKALEHDLVAIHLRQLAQVIFTDFAKQVKEEKKMRQMTQGGRGQ